MSDDRTAWLRRFYDSEAAGYDATRGGEPRGALAAAAFAQLLGPPGGPGGPVLEVGTGTAVVAGELRRRGYPVLGVDVSLGMLRQAGSRLPGCLVQGDGAALPLPDAGCRAVVLSWVLHLVDNPLDLVREAARVIEPGGRLVTTVNKSASSRAVATAQPVTTETREVTDDPLVLGALAAELGLEPSGSASYVAQGQHGAPTYEIKSWARPARAPGPR
ncbi:class I SAM-dependent methyltransferase [Angustibacter luteus]|uniref:Class I SAM-dependent methyltransferase n=1 Tax=Angustibacter luteus TaxID=658456 RepID=A0ABW1JKS5_9ACTN